MCGMTGVCAAIAAWSVLCAPVLAQDSLNDLEKRAGDAFSRNDCTAAASLYRAAVEIARTAGQWNQAALYYRRIGICAYRTGDIDAAWSAYHEGSQVAEKANDPEMLRENLHGSAVALRHLGRRTEALDAA